MEPRAYGISLEVRGASQELLRMMYLLDDGSMEEAREALSSPRQCLSACDLVDCLPFDEALLVCALLLRRGLRHGVDFGVYRCGLSYGVMLGREASRVAASLIQDLQSVRVIQRIATGILRRWRSSYGRREGDVYEALELASKAVAERSRLSSGRCPWCGGSSGVEVREALHGRSYVISVRRVCCSHREKAIIELGY